MRQRAINTKTRTAAASEAVASSAKMKRAVDALVVHLRDKKKPRKERQNIPEPRLSDFGLFTEQQIRDIWLIANKQSNEVFDEAEFVKQMAKTTPVVARPRVNGLVDFWRMLAVPEIVE